MDELRVLVVLCRAPFQTASDIAEQTGLSTQKVVPILETFAKAGWAIRTEERSGGVRWYQGKRAKDELRRHVLEITRELEEAEKVSS